MEEKYWFEPWNFTEDETVNIADGQFSEPLRKLTNNEGDVSENLREMSPVIEEVGRIIYSNSTVTINLAWGLAAALGLGLCEYSPECPRPV